jgi:TetR/AcrR family transcriptional regulator
MNNTRHRDLARTRARILKAALAEFAAKGLAGARVDAIARRARVNKRMLFYCFGSKAALYREVLRRKLGENLALVETVPSSFGETLLRWCEAVSSDRQWIRMHQWEALGGGQTLVAEDERRELFKRALTVLRDWTKQGSLPGDVDCAQLLILVLALTSFPVAFPQITRLIAGVSPESARFRRAQRGFLSWLGERICNSEGLACRRVKVWPPAGQTARQRSR